MGSLLPGPRRGRWRQRHFHLRHRRIGSDVQLERAAELLAGGRQQLFQPLDGLTRGQLRA
jgi:hypothetical protein